MVNPKLMDTANRLGAGITPTVPELQMPMPTPTTLDERIVQLDESPEYLSKRSQDEWIRYWNDINDGRVMASMPDYYHAFKQLKHASENGIQAEKEQAQKKMKIIRDSMDLDNENRIVSSTRIIYETDGLNAMIIHHYKCKDPSFIKQKEVLIPDWNNRPELKQALKREDGLKFLQALFDTTDDGEKILRIFEYINGKASENPHVSVRSSKERVITQNVESNLAYFGHVKISNKLPANEIGFSFGVSYKNP